MSTDNSPWCDLLSPEEIAAQTGLSLPTIRRKSPAIEKAGFAKKIGRNWLYLKPAIEILKKKSIPLKK